MPDDRKKRGAADRSKVAALQAHEVKRVAERFGLSANQVKTIIEQVGNERAKVEAAARAMNRK